MITLIRATVTVMLLFVVIACAPLTLPADAQPTLAPTEEASTEPSAQSAPDTVAPARSFRIDPAASSVTYRAYEEFFGRAINTHAPYTLPIGRTSAMTGTIAVDLIDGQLQIEPTEWVVNVRSFTSDDPRRDKRIRENYLYSNDQPFARFVPTGATDFPSDYQEGSIARFAMAGDLTVRATTQPVIFDVDAVLTGDVISATATTRINMPDFDVYPPRLLNFVVVQDPLDVTVQVQAIAEP
jgi:polyisoprenoid-binding protein YceI